MGAPEERTCSLVEGCIRPETMGGGCLQHKFEGGLHITGVALFRHDREHGTTQAFKAREMFDDARRDKKQIAQVRGRRGPTHVRHDGEWVKA